MDEAPMEAGETKTVGTRRYTPEEKAEFVLMGLRNPGRISEMCRERHVAPISYSRWKKTYLAGGLEALRKGKRVTSIELEQENRMLKEVVGNLYIELECVKKKLEAVR